MTVSFDATPAPLYGHETRLALQNFPPHGRLLTDVPELLRAYAWVKAATADANVELGVLDALRAGPIVAAADELASGALDRHFALPLVQGGGGTSTNMNVNEVLAARATVLLADAGHAETVHPIDHVNRSQSTNDSYPTAMALALVRTAARAEEALGLLERSLLTKAEEHDGRERLGRTCLQDAVPLTVGQTHRAQAHAVRRNADGLGAAARLLLSVPLGGTAVGSGLGAPAGFAKRAVQHLRVRSGLPVEVAPDFFDSLAHADPYSALGAAAARSAVLLGKIAADLRVLSAPSLLGGTEITLPRLQAGSSIMPGKVNPVVPELVMQLGFRIRGAVATADLGVAAGELELNVMEPIILDGLHTALTDLAYAAEVFATTCIDGLVWNDEVLERNLQYSRQGLVELSMDTGYDNASAVSNSDLRRA